MAAKKESWVLGENSSCGSIVACMNLEFSFATSKACYGMV